MEINLFSLSLITLGIIQIIMIVKFFEIANDIRSIKCGFFKLIKNKEDDTEKDVGHANYETNKQDLKRENEDPAKFTWQSWAIIIIFIIVAVYLFALYH